jgi:hypothetical protein
MQSRATLASTQLPKPNLILVQMKSEVYMVPIGTGCIFLFSAGIEPRALHMLDKCRASELRPQPKVALLIVEST